MRIESAPSAPTCVTPVDTFPPAPPKSLALIAGGNGVSLLWEANTEADLGGYLVLRGEAPGDKLSPLTKAPITDTSFLDTTARRGRTYVYQVVAVDRSTPPNQSAPSEPCRGNDTVSVDAGCFESSTRAPLAMPSSRTAPIGSLTATYSMGLPRRSSSWMQLRRRAMEVKPARILCPVTPSKVVAIGLNYKDHAAEMNKPLPSEPLMFMKPSTAVIGPGDAIRIPPDVGEIHYEAELGVVIGKRASRVSADKAMEHVLGLTCLIDVTARELQRKDVQYTRAKGFDTFAPIGPCIAVGLDPSALDVEGWLNGERKQASNTRQLIFTVPQIVAFVSSVMTLLPGDVIATGTPSGVGPLKTGDTFTVKIEGIGELSNPVSNRQTVTANEELDMKLFVDTGNVKEIQALADIGIIDGVTTNPSLMAKESGDYRKTMKEICRIVQGPVSAEVLATDWEGMIREGRDLATIDEHIVVKVPFTRDGVRACKTLSREGLKVNVTLVFSAAQALLAAKAGAAMVSPFVGRLDDVGQTGMRLIQEIVDIYRNYPFKTEVLVASTRHPIHIIEAAKMGADICTCPPKVIDQLFKHPLTDIGLANFLKDWEKSQAARV